MDQNNGGIIGKINTPTTSVASGVWSLDSQFESQSGSTWPLAFPQVTLANACRFNAASSDFLHRMKSNSDEITTMTFSCWVKRCSFGSTQRIFSHMTASFVNYFYFRFENDDKLAFASENTGSYDANYKTNRVFRDASAWYHLVARIDTTASGGNRIRIYVNGEQETSFVSSTEPDQNSTFSIGTTSDPMVIGGLYGSGYGIGSGSSTEHFDGYITEAVMCEGQSLDPTSFGAFNPVTNIWEPRPYAGTYGTNGFKLNFTDSSNLGDDTSGNGNDFTVNNLTSVDQSTDTCSNNFATLNPLDKGYTGTITLSEGNLVTESSSGAGDTGLRSTIGVTTGKWYLEAKIASSNTIVIGDIDARLQSNMNDGSPADDFYGIQRYSDTKTNLYNDGTFVSQNTAMWGGFTSSDIISIALDLDNNKIFFAKNGSFKDSSGNTGDPANGTNPTFTISDGTKTYTFYTELRGNDADGLLINFGNPPFTISSGNADANGFGNFEYAVPSGFLALCTKNLAENG